LPGVRLLVASVLALLTLAAPARAADPILPLPEVRAGMKCSALSVIRGVEPVSFDAEVIDVVEGDPSSDGPRILMSVSGAAVDGTGIGPGFSGSPVYCPDAQGRPANAGAISESIGEYGGKVALATPIEAILGNPPDAPAAAVKRPGLLRRARTLASPLTVSGLRAPLVAALDRAGARRGRRVLQAPPAPLRSFPPQALRPGSAVGVGYSSGALSLGATGTVAYEDAGRVWSFGHPLDSAGRRNLLLQDAYVYRVVGNPNVGGESGSTYKLAAPAHDVGTVSNDALTAVVGRLGRLPRTVPVRVTVRDQDTKAQRSALTRVADETDLDDPLGSSLTSLVAPLAVLQVAGGTLKSSPARVSGDACLKLTVRELGKPLRVCNRYVGDSAGGENGLGNAVAIGTATDVEAALELVASYTTRALHVDAVEVGVRIRRGADVAYMRDLELPRRVRAGRTVRARLRVQQRRGPERRLVVPLKLPSNLERGSRRIVLRGEDADSSEASLLESLVDLGDESDGEGEERARDGSALDEGPQSFAELRKAILKLERYDGVSLFVDSIRGKGRPAFRDPQLRYAGRVSDRVRVR
jgi:hypothetical protein